MWAWRARRLARVRRAILSCAVAWIALAITTAVQPGIQVAGLGALLVAGVLIALLNALSRLVFLWLLVPVPLFLARVAAFVFQAAVIVVLGDTIPGVHVDGLTAAVWGSVILTLLDSVLAEMVRVSDDESYYGTLVRQLVARSRPSRCPPGILIVQIDGLSLPVMEHAARAARIPVIAGLLRDGRLAVRAWTAMAPSTTPASQAGILHGRNDDIPGFRWFDKLTGRLVVANHPADARAIAVGLSDGTGLLAEGGASVGNLFDGDATQSYLTMATLTDPVMATADRRRLHGFFVSTVDYVHLLVLMIGEVAKELYQAESERSANVRPRMRRGLTYAAERALTNVTLRNLSTALVIEELYAGAPIVYVDYTGYDAIAHHCGPERPESIDALTGIDRAVGTLLRAVRTAPRTYHLVLLSDHGQNLAATFRQRCGRSLEQVIASLMGGRPAVLPASEPVEHRGTSGRILLELARRQGPSSVLGRAVPRSLRAPGALIHPAGGHAPTRGSHDESRPDVVVCASGNLALVYFTIGSERLSMEAIDDRYPGLIDGLAEQPGVGFILAHSQILGPVVASSLGRRALRDNTTQQGADPLAPYGDGTVANLQRLDGFANAGDLVVLGTRDDQTGEWTSFEELVGSHGGLGGWQTAPFLAYPASWQLDEEPIIGAPAMHRQLAHWRANLQGEPAPAAGGQANV